MGNEKKIVVEITEYHPFRCPVCWSEELVDITPVVQEAVGIDTNVQGLVYVCKECGHVFREEELV